MLYADDAGVVSQPPEQLRKMMGVILLVCAVFGLTVSEVKTEIMSVRTKGMPESTAIFSVKAAGQVYNQSNEFVYLEGNVNHNANLSIEVNRRIGQVYNQTNEFVYLGGNVNHNTDLSNEISRCICNAWCSFRKYTLGLYDRQSAPHELKS